MKTLITAEAAKTWKTGIVRRCLPAIFCAALASSASAQTEQAIFNFSFDGTGWAPAYNGYLLVEPNGDLIGTAQYGGIDEKGTGIVFEASPPTKKDPNWRYKVIHRFTKSGVAGTWPANGLTLGANNLLYGMTTDGASPSGCGAVYQLTPSAPGTPGQWEWGIAYIFNEIPSSEDGCEPYNAQLLYDANTGSFYGTTSHGGTYHYGTLFRLDPPAQGSYWTETVLHSFYANSSDGAYPSGGLAGDPDGGIIYGTAQQGGAGSCGVVWAYNTSTGEMSTLYAFQANNNPADGAGPMGGVIGPFSSSINNDAFYLLGTTEYGGNNDCSGGGGCGTVFAINVSLSSQGQTVTETQLHAFTGPDGAFPVSGLTIASGGAWGTAMQGGPAFYVPTGTGGDGTLFEIQITSHLTYTTLTYVPVSYFLGYPADGANPATGLGADSAGNLYGMTSSGGANGAGALFKVVP
jgi:uncharacterized repeat protein (TIGR03803 family)